MLHALKDGSLFRFKIQLVEDDAVNQLAGAHVALQITGEVACL